VAASAILPRKAMILSLIDEIDLSRCCQPSGTKSPEVRQMTSDCGAIVLQA